MSYPGPQDSKNPSDMPAVSPLEMPPHVAEQIAQNRRRINPKSPRQALQPEAAPPPPPRSQKARHPLVVVLNFFLMIVVVVTLAGGAALYFGKARFTQPGPLAEPASVVVARGSNLDTITAQLARQNIIGSRLIFTTAVRLYNAENRLQAGEYMFEPGVSMQRVLEDITSGRSVLHSITFPEGLTSTQVVARLIADPVLEGTIEQVPPEGSLAPDTYKFARGDTRPQILDQMARAQDRIVDEAWSRRDPDLPLDSPEQFVTLASIVEKETGRADERPRVAAVFINRLRAGMRLQSDPTVLYGLFGGEGRPPDRQIFQSDLDKETPYNTYQIRGLPPAPIANPGRAALEAVANPSRTEELYFVADGTGGHAFASTLDQHNRNVARWRQIESDRAVAPGQNGAAPADDAAVPGNDAPAEGADQPADSAAPQP